MKVMVVHTYYNIIQLMGPHCVGRFASVSDEDFEELLKNKDAENTLKAKQALHVLRAFT